MRKKRNPKKRIGTRELFSALVMAFLFGSVLPSASGFSKNKAASDTYAVISGSVFDSSGYALPGVEATLVPDTVGRRTKPLEATSDARGEFIFRVPEGPAHYILTVAAKGRQTQQKTLTVEGQERIEVTFQLESESK